MTGKRFGSGRRRSGQALVEFALILPILLLLILGLVDFARAWSAHHAVADAAREGARMVVMFDASTEIEDARLAILERLQNAGLNEAPVIEIEQPDGAGRNRPTIVTIEYPFRLAFVGPLMGLFGAEDQTLRLRSRFVMRNE